eukprot:Blabericola_migrator_1__1647@NODE_1441_length_4539_cov_72_482111_g957_i0_p3_GENE_NODE_1441_length_4539_cov_72_482111_g957_i0NODE_1441_length_4539_cov_72_482111_g957_i0_p3_ORF_typecomplete_len319_score39_64P34Arc/PF04045_14/0_0052_NODE_1441_length_4539_cov_72_482111_g957_i015172473
MPSFEDSLFGVELRLTPHSAINKLALDHLCGSKLCLVGYQVRAHIDGLKYWIFWNPFVAEVAEADETFRELHGLILLVSGSEWPDRMIKFNTDLLMGALADYVVLPFREEWKCIRHMLKRLELERNGRRFPKFLFAVVFPEDVVCSSQRRRVTLAHDFAMAGTTFLASQIECRLSVFETHVVDELALRPQEFILLECSPNQIRLTFGEEFSRVQDRVLATWICKQMSRRGGHENQAARQRWWMSYSFEPPPRGRKIKNIKGIFVTWAIERPHGDQQDFNIMMSLLGVAFRPFLQKAISQLKCYHARTVADGVALMYRF